MRRYAQLSALRNVGLRIVHFGRSGENATQFLKDAAEYFQADGFEAETKVVHRLARDLLIEYAQQDDMELVLMGYSIRLLIFRHLLDKT